MAEKELIIKMDAVSDKDLCGQKAFALSALMKAESPVPEFFVISSQAFKNFMDKNSLKSRIIDTISSINFDNVQSIKEAALGISSIIMSRGLDDGLKDEIKDAYEELSMGSDVKRAGGVALELIKAGGGSQAVVCVRPSPVMDYHSNSFAGQAESRFNVRGFSTLCDSIKFCWASLFTHRAMAYRNIKGLGFPATGVIIQKMINPEKSGTLLTTNPFNKESVLIESCWGLGEPIYRGLLSPDEYVIDKTTGTISKKISTKTWFRKRDHGTETIVTGNVPHEKVSAETLSNNNISALMNLARTGERVFGCPVNIEWCEKRGMILALQATPTINKESATKNFTEGEITLRGFPASAGISSGRVKMVSGNNDIELSDRPIIVSKGPPDITPYLSMLSGLITDSGCRTSYLAILCREFGIPYVVSENASTKLSDSQEITLDGNSGNVFLPITKHMQEPEYAYAGAQEPTAPKTELPSLTASDKLTATQIRVNLRFPVSFEEHKKADGVGLISLETLFMHEKKHPLYMAKENPDKLVSMIESYLEHTARDFYPRPVCYRFLDMRSDEFRDLEGSDEENETNPSLGWRGIRRILGESDVIRCELRAVKNLIDKGLKNISVTFPYVSTPFEFQRAKEHINFPVKTGVMIETPASAIEIEKFCKEGMDFACIGVDSLVQLLMGVDKENAKVSWLYSETNESALKLIKHVIDTCKKHGIEIAVNGEAGNNSELARILVSAGIDSISCNPEYLDEIRTAVAREERKILLERYRKNK